MGSCVAQPQPHLQKSPSHLTTSSQATREAPSRKLSADAADSCLKGDFTRTTLSDEREVGFDGGTESFDCNPVRLYSHYPEEMRNIMKRLKSMS